MLGIGAFRVFMGTRLNIEPYSPLKPIKVGFIFIRPNSLSRAEDLAAVNHWTQAVVRVGSKIGSIKVGFKELRLELLELKLLNRGLRLNLYLINHVEYIIGVLCGKVISSNNFFHYLCRKTRKIFILGKLKLK